MNVLIVGIGKTGSFLAADLARQGVHSITAIEIDREVASRAPGGSYRMITGDGCEPSVLEAAGVRKADLVIATTGHDEDNLVIAQLARLHFGAGRVIARVNNPRNHWLFTREWGVDVAISPTHFITKLIEEEMSLGDLVTLLKLRGGNTALAEITLKADSKATGRRVGELGLPDGSLLVAIIRGGETFYPAGDFRLEAEDEVLAITSVDKEPELLRVLEA